ncbi:MAG: hydrolase [Bacillota bacterium]|nr:hydrolase [Bacillota bacterium]
MSCYYEYRAKKSVKKEVHENNCCRGCGCASLKGLQPGTKVSVTISGSNETTSNLFFTNLNPLNCCAYFVDPTGGETADTLIIDCEKIEAIRVLNAY